MNCSAWLRAVTSDSKCSWRPVTGGVCMAEGRAGATVFNIFINDLCGGTEGTF